VESGHCTLKHFTVGEVDYSMKFHNMTTMYYERLIQHNETILKGLQIIQNTFKPPEGRLNLIPFKYYRILTNSTLRLTNGDHLIKYNKDDKNQNQNPYQSIIDVFETEIQIINQHITNLNVIYNNPEKYINISEYWLDDSTINRWYNEYCTEMDKYKCKQWITIIKVNDYLLHPSTLLDEIGTIIGVKVPKTIQELEKLLNKTNNSSKIGGMNDTVFEFETSKTITNEIQNKDQSFGYYECLFLCFIYEKVFLEKINKDDDEDKMLFAMVYDHYVSLLQNDTNIDTILPGIIEFNNTKQEDDILLKGNELGEYIYFSENLHYTDRTKQLNRIMVKHARKINVKKRIDQLIENNKNKTNGNKKRKIDNPPLINYRQVSMVSRDDNMPPFKRPAIFANGGKKKQTKKKKSVKKRNTKKRRRTIKNKIK
jgi:hypothetical protein